MDSANINSQNLQNPDEVRVEESDTIDNTCYIGRLLNSNSKCYQCTNENYLIEDLSEEDTILLGLRVVGFEKKKNEVICKYHFDNRLVNYQSKWTCCCNPVNLHPSSIKKSLTAITLDFHVEVLSACNVILIPGQKLCRKCFSKLKSQIEEKKLFLKTCMDPGKRHRTKYISDSLLTVKWRNCWIFARGV